MERYTERISQIKKLYFVSVALFYQYNTKSDFIIYLKWSYSGLLKQPSVLKFSFSLYQLLHIESVYLISASTSDISEIHVLTSINLN